MQIQSFMRVFFNLLYHPFAFSYDLVAATVSFGQWTNWIAEILPHVEGKRVLELGHGPGHLQRVLIARGYQTTALDESTQMGRIAAKRLGGKHQLTRGLAQDLPFANASFDSIVSTFPTEYIFDPSTLQSIRRVLSPRGKLIVLPVTFPNSKLLQWLYRITGESPAVLNADMQEKIKQPFTRAGFKTDIIFQQSKNSTLLIILAENSYTQN